MTLPPDIYSVESVRKIDQVAINDAGIGGYTLMTRAGQAALSAIRGKFPDARRWQVICGSGNNGGDGYVVARLAAEQGHVRPKVDDSLTFKVAQGRHPVVEPALPPGAFVPNDCRLGQDPGRFALITGPNMAGKSTFLRQTALLSLMAQIGSFLARVLEDRRHVRRDELSILAETDDERRPLAGDDDARGSGGCGGSRRRRRVDGTRCRARARRRGTDARP